MKLINRELYVNKILRFKDKDLVKILIGVRRSGKSTILQLLQQNFLNNGVKKEQIISINFEENRNKNLRSADSIHDYVEKNIIMGEKNYLFIDEVQEVEEWAKTINSLKVTYELDIYVTGSNSNLFSGFHLTYLSGRYVSFEIFPLSFQEFKKFNMNNGNSDEVNYEIFNKGSFPAVVLENQINDKEDMIRDLYDAIYLRDIALGGNIRLSKQLENISRHLFESIGKIISIKKIYESIKREGVDISSNTVSSYLSLFEAAYLIYHCKRYDLKGRKLLETNGKYYAIDLALAKHISSNIAENVGYNLENFVFLELKKAGFQVHTLIVNREYELDFLAIKGDKRMYIQVSLSILDENTLKREIRPFKYIKGNGEKILLTLDNFIFNLEECKHKNVFKFVNELT